MFGQFVRRNRLSGDFIAIAQPLQQIAILAAGAAEGGMFCGRRLLANRAFLRSVPGQNLSLPNQIWENRKNEYQRHTDWREPGHQKAPKTKERAFKPGFSFDQFLVSLPAHEDRG